MVRLKNNFSKPNLVKRRLRTACGAYLLELLVAMFVSGMMALALTTRVNGEAEPQNAAARCFWRFESVN